MRGRSRWPWLLCLLLAAPLHAQEVPPPLRDWQAWVLHDVPAHACPPLADQPAGNGANQCAWPSRLAIETNADGGYFTMDVHVDGPSWIALPGDERDWPQQVSIDGHPAIVLQRQSQPMLWLAAGDYHLQGELPWRDRPARLRVPAAIGLVSLKLDGTPVARIERDGDELTLGEAVAAQRTADTLSLRVYRRLVDGLPAMLDTQLQLNVTGTAREQRLGPVLPSGFLATALDGELPAQLEPDGRLRVQLKPGQWTITLSARAVDPLAKLVLHLPAAPWPRQEIWSYADDPDLRGSHVEGRATDAAQAGVPDEWRELPAFALDDADGLSVVPGARGDTSAPTDRLQLNRRLWLDFDGAHYSVADHLTGELRHLQRLDVLSPWQLQRATQDGEALLVSRGADGRSGVEVRTHQLALDAGLRLPASGALPVTGWQLPLDRIDATLQLPPGYRLLGAPGADRSPDSWVAQWSLLDVFGVAVIALLAGRLLGWPWALLAAGFLALGQHEIGAPRWTLAVALALALLLRALPEGRLRVFARLAALTAFALAVLWTLPFAARQLQYALHPQLEAGAFRRAVQVRFIEPAAQDTDAAAAALKPVAQMAMPPPPPPPSPPAPPAVEEQVSAPSPASPSPALDVGSMTDSRSLIQAGAGTPGWQLGNEYRLGWSGPVMPGQSARLLIAPAWLVRLLRVVMIGLLAALLARLLPSLLAPWRGRWPSWSNGAQAALLALALLPWHAHAQSLPSEQLLEQLRGRLTEAPGCAPSCASLPQMHVGIGGDLLELTLEADAGAPLALPLPDTALPLVEASVDGHPATLAREASQPLLRLETGVHRVLLRYRLDGADSARLRFVLKPERVIADANGWAIDGVDDARLLGDSLALDRLRQADGGRPLAPTQDFPPYVRLTRHLVLGVEWMVRNEVERIAPAHGGFSVTLPLLPGEHPLGDAAAVQGGRIHLAFNADTEELTWTSRLDRSAQLSLQAPALGERAEVWEIEAAPMWHVQAQGVPISASDSGLRYQPLPGERLQLAIDRPVAQAGGSLAFDSVRLHSEVGPRATESTLELEARSTRGGEQTIDLPADAQLLQTARDGEALPLATHDGQLALPLLPGTHHYALRLREPLGAGARTRTPSFALHAPAANLDLTLQLPQDRWVLWTWGPAAGPAVLYWSQLIVLLLAAWLLGRYAPTPLRWWHWLLLGLGFSAFAWSAYVLVASWLILLGLRARFAPQRLGVAAFDLLQLGLAGLTALALAVLVAAVPEGLLGLPDMHVAGMNSSAWRLHWFADNTVDALPRGGAFSLPLWTYKLAMLAWALWLANALIGWLRWGFEAWSSGGYWRRRSARSAIPPELPLAATDPAADA